MKFTSISKFRLRYRSNPIWKITLILKLKVIYGYRSSVLIYRSFFDIEVIDSFGPGSCWRRVADSECRLQLGTGVTEHRLQCTHFIAAQVLAQALKQFPVRSALRRCKRNAGETEAKAKSWMVLMPPVAQPELTQFNRDLFRADAPLSLVSFRTGCFVLPAKWNALSITMKGPRQLHDFWRQLVKGDEGETVLVNPAH